VTDTDDPAPLIELGFGFWRAKALLAAVELGIFTLLAREPKTASELSSELALHPRGASDFLDALVALGLLARDEEQRYANTPLAAQFLDRERPSYLGGLFEMAEQRLYPVWGKLTDALRSGEPQNEARREPDYYSNLTSDPQRLRTFLRGMTGLSRRASRHAARRTARTPVGHDVRSARRCAVLRGVRHRMRAFGEAAVRSWGLLQR
jgi:hypothetical protein